MLFKLSTVTYTNNKNSHILTLYNIIFVGMDTYLGFLSGCMHYEMFWDSVAHLPAVIFLNLIMYFWS